MNWLDRLERRFRRFAVPNVTQGIVMGQIVVGLLGFALPNVDSSVLMLIPAQVAAGEVWRLVTMLVVPPFALTRPFHLILAGFAWWLFWLMGTALEERWGTFRYNAFLAAGYLLTLGAGLLTPWQPVSVAVLGASVFLAFAWLFPDFSLLLFFILPVKVKWLAVLAWLGIGWTLAVGPLFAKLQALAGVGNVFLFLGRDMWLAVRQRGRRRQVQVAARRVERTANHVCEVCGTTDLDDPRMEFRYCSRCEPVACYCREHLEGHEHRRAAAG